MDIISVLFITMSTQHGLPPKLLSSLCWVESNHRVHVINYGDGSDDSLGICQIQYKTAKWLGFKGTKKELMLPENNIKYAAKYLQKQINRYNGSIEKAVIAYNFGSAKSFTTSKYQRKVFKKWKGK